MSIDVGTVADFALTGCSTVLCAKGLLKILSIMNVHNVFFPTETSISSYVIPVPGKPPAPLTASKSVRTARMIGTHALFTKSSKARLTYSLDACLRVAIGFALFAVAELKGLNHFSVYPAQTQVVSVMNWYGDQFLSPYPCSIFTFLTVSSLPLGSQSPYPSTPPDTYLSGKRNFAKPCKCLGCSASVVPTVSL